jgi:DNA invertase Pin-like site-specific DNA recombinase
LVFQWIIWCFEASSNFLFNSKENSPFHLFAALAEFEREIIRERTKAGLESARSRGRVGGRPKGLSKEAKDKAIIASTLYSQKQMSVSQICKHLGIAKSTFYKYLWEN